MKLQKGQVIEITIGDLAFGGEGVGRLKVPDGKDFVVFVGKAAPGDTVSARLTKIKKNYAEAELEKIVKPSPSRALPRCKHFEYCGGCSLQFLRYVDQLKWKEKMVRDALEKIGGLHGIKIAPIMGCENEWFYRNKMEFSFGEDFAANTGLGRQQLAIGRQRLALGLHPAKKYQEVFDLEECFLESETSVKIVRAVREWAIQTNSGVLKNLIIREGKNTGEFMVNLVTNRNAVAEDKTAENKKSDAPPLTESITESQTESFKELIAKNFRPVASLYHTEVTVRRGFKTVIKENLLMGKPTLSETLRVQFPQGKIQELKFEILPQAFFQPNTLQAQTLYSKVLELAAPTAADTVLDLFCGTGTIGMFFAFAGAQTFGIDNNESAIKNALENAKYNNLKNIEFLCGDAGAPIKSIQKKPTVLITDPPRAGIFPSALRNILEMNVPKWIYVSCNPATLARDLAIIVSEGRYSIEIIQPIDMFPQTFHVETVVLLHR